MTDPYKPKGKPNPKAFLVGNAAFLKHPGVIHLDKLKQVVDADQQDLIKPADVDLFLKAYFKESSYKLMDFKSHLDHLYSAIAGKILEMVADEESVTTLQDHKPNEVPYSTKDVSDILGVQKQTVVNWVNNGWLVAKRNVEAGKFYIAEADLVAFLNTSNGKKYLKIWNVKTKAK